LPVATPPITAPLAAPIPAPRSVDEHAVSDKAASKGTMILYIEVFSFSKAKRTERRSVPASSEARLPVAISGGRWQALRILIGVLKFAEESGVDA
jgi:hypothetical protein